MRSYTWMWITLGIVIIAGVALWLMTSQQPAANNIDTGAASNVTGGEQVATTTGSTNADTGSSSASGTTFTAALVATHSTAASCWTIIDGNVYDLTNWIGKHPGGPEAIRQLCGKDGTAIFHGQHGDNKTQVDILVTYKIGTLAQ